MFDVIFKNEYAQKNNIIVAKRPSIPAPEKRIELIEVAGRDGALVVDEGTYSPIEFEIDFNFLSNDWQGTFTLAKNYLNGSGEMAFSDDLEHFYKVYYITITDSDRESARKGSFTAEVNAAPFRYLQSGKLPLPLGDLTNNYYKSEPIYSIKGNGLCTLTVNGNVFKANVAGELIINTELQESYLNNGNIANAYVQGDYNDLKLQEGLNQISLSNGFTGAIIPNWREL